MIVRDTGIIVLNRILSAIYVDRKWCEFQPRVSRYCTMLYMGLSRARDRQNRHDSKGEIMIQSTSSNRNFYNRNQPKLVCVLREGNGDDKLLPRIRTGCMH